MIDQLQRILVTYSTFLVLASLLQGCQTPKLETVSIDEAKRLTADIGSRSYTSPPRSIEDILTLLRTRSTAATREMTDAWEVATGPDPSGAEPAKAAALYLFRRGKANWRVGRWGTARADMRRAHALLTEAPSPGKPDRSTVALELARMEINGGDYTKGVRLMLEAAKTEQQPGASLALGLANAGDLDGAWEKTEEALALLNSLRSTLPEMAEWRPLWVADIDSVFAKILELRGQPSEAEPYRRRSIERIGAAKVSSTKVREYTRQAKLTHETSLARNLLQQDRATEAEFTARLALRKAISAFGVQSEAARSALNALEGALTAQGRYRESLRLLEEDIVIQGEMGVSAKSVPLALSHRRKGEILTAQSDWAGARQSFDRARQILSGDKAAERLFVSGNLSWAITEIRSGAPAQGLAVARDAWNKRSALYGKDRYETAEARAVMAMAEDAVGRKEEALRGFREAFPLLGGGRSGSRLARSADARSRFQQIVATYLKLLNDLRSSRSATPADTDAFVIEAFQVAESARGTSVTDTIASAAARSKVIDPEIRDLVRREQDTGRQIEAAYQLLANVSGDDDLLNGKAASLRAQVQQLKTARRSIKAEIADRFPEYAELTRHTSPTPLNISGVLSNEEVLVSLYATETAAFVWGVDSTGQVEFHVSPTGEEEIGDAVALLRSAVDVQVRNLGEIPDFDIDEAYRLFRRLLQPVLMKFTKARSLVFVVDGYLSQLPFSLLPTSAPRLGEDRNILFERYGNVDWLARSYAVSKVPSANALLSLRTGTAPDDRPRKPFIGFGDPFFNTQQLHQAKQELTSRSAQAEVFGLRSVPIRLRTLPDTGNLRSATIGVLPRLPETSDELLSIANLLEVSPMETVFLGKRATEQAVKGMDLRPYRVISFATHGLAAGELDGLRHPALALSAPEVTGTTDDGLLTMEEILGLKMNADWTILSACNTASGSADDKEYLAGLGRAFFFAGTKALLVSNWAVHSASTKELMTRLFLAQKNRRDGNRARALQHAMLHMIDHGHYEAEGRVFFSYAHPLFWAPFSLIGDGG